MDNIEVTLDTDYAPDLCQEEDFLGMEQDEVKFIIVKYLINDDFSIALLEHTDKNIEDIHKMIDEGLAITILGFGCASHTSIPELMYGLNHPTRVLFRSGVNDIVQKFEEGDRLLRLSLKEQL